MRRPILTVRAQGPKQVVGWDKPNSASPTYSPLIQKVQRGGPVDPIMGDQAGIAPEIHPAQNEMAHFSANLIAGKDVAVYRRQMEIE